jgi:long-chain acyl-CoA synthetase
MPGTDVQDSEETVSGLPPTIAQLPFFAGGRFPKPDLLGQCGPDGVVYTSGRELTDRVRDLSLGLSALGMSRGDRVALLSENRPEWLLSDLATQAAGAVTIPIYPTLSDEQVAFILRDSGAAIAIASTPLQVEKLLAARPHVPDLTAIVVMEATAGDADRTFDEVAQLGHSRIVDGWGVAREFHDRARSVQADDLATIIYTSGTTGEPKGVMLTHGNLMANIAGVRAVLDLGPEDVGLSFLPLCHAFERLVAYFYLVHGVSIVFAESFNTIARDLQMVRPTVTTGVPRVFEKLHDRVIAKGLEASGLKRRIFQRAVQLASVRGRLLESGRPLSPWLRLQAAVADRLVYRRVREVMGGRLRFAVSGGAPLRPEIGRFFFGVGIPLIEGYGLTETAPVLTVMPLDAIRFGTVGRPLPNVELRIADDGEVLARGPNVMVGYFGRPDETAQVLRDGWFHTGDVGSVDEDGYLRITDRKKELIVTSGGKNIAPQPIEGALRAHPLIAEAVVIGEQRAFLALLIVPDLAALQGRFPDARDAASLQGRQEITAAFQEAVDAINARLAQFERIRRFALLPREFSIEAGELTPTLKVKRRVVEERYRDQIEGLYR